MVELLGISPGTKMLKESKFHFSRSADKMDSSDAEETDRLPENLDLIFEEGSFTLPELLESHLLPVVVQYDMERQPLPCDEYNFDFSQPLLLYKKRNIQVSLQAQ